MVWGINQNWNLVFNDRIWSFLWGYCDDSHQYSAGQSLFSSFSLAWSGPLKNQGHSSFWERFKKEAQHGFSLPERIKPEEEKFISEIVSRSEKYGLNVPLMIFLEGLTPLYRVTASLLTGLEPFAEFFFPLAPYRKLIGFLENRENLEKLKNKLNP